jgi:4-amino-4-deoxy-L-arabinose transferase-like glycosyltransferase
MNYFTARIAFAALVLISILILFFDIATKELHATSVFYAALARELVENADPLFIFTGPEAYLLKPPLTLWMSAISMQWLGFTHAAATLPPRLAGFAVVLLTYALMKRMFDTRVAMLAAFILVTNSTFIQFSTTLRMDPLVLTGILLALLGWLDPESRRGSAFVFAGITIAILAKGPIGLLAIGLMAIHWLLVPETRRSPINYSWSMLLALPLAWYGYLALEHGASALFSVSNDFMRASANPDLNFAQSTWLEYGVKPFRRYWPWLPFMLVGLLMPMWHLYRGEWKQTATRNKLWLMIWTIVVVLGSALKPDHDIRYLYPALPALAGLAGVVVAALLDQTKTWIVFTAVAVLLAGTVWLLRVKEYQDWRPDLHAMQAHVNQHRLSYKNPVVVPGHPITPGSPRRQNTHRDWIFYYLGVEPRIVSHSDSTDDLSTQIPYVLTARSRGFEERLRALGFESLYVTKKMVLAIPNG